MIRSLRRSFFVIPMGAGLLIAGASGAYGQKAPASQPSDREQRLAGRHDARQNEEVATLFRTAETTYLVGDPARASDLFQQLLNSNPNSTFTVRSNARMGDCAYELKKYAEAGACYRRAAAAVEASSNSDETNAAIRADYMVGQSCLAAKDYTQAFSQFRRFIDKHPGHALVNQAYQCIGDAHVALEQYQQALVAYRMVGTVIGEKTSAHRRITPGQRLYLRVDDADVNVGETPRSVTATIKTTSGDVETVELEPLGMHSPIFLGTIPTALGAARHSGDIKTIFSEATAIRIRQMLIDAEKLEQTGKAKAAEAAALEQSPRKAADPAGVEKARAGLVAESQQLLTKAQANRQDAIWNIDDSFSKLEKLVAGWSPTQSLEAMKERMPSTRPATAPVAASGPATAPSDPNQKVVMHAPGSDMSAALGKPLTGTDDDQTFVPSGDAQQRGMSEDQILRMRLEVSKAPTTLDTIDARLTTLSVWSRLLVHQFQRLEIVGGDKIEIEYFDEIGPAGRNEPGKAIRKDTVEVAADARIEILTKDGQEPLVQAILNSDVLLRVEDFDRDVSNDTDSVTVTIAAVPMTDKRLAELHAGQTPASQPTTQRATPGAVAEATTQPVEILPLVPEGAKSIKVTLVETGPHTGVFEKIVHVGNDELTDKGVALKIRDTDAKDSLYAFRVAYADQRAVRNPDGWVIAKSADCLSEGSGSVAAVKYRTSQLDLEAKLKRAVAAGEIGKIYLDLGLTKRGRSYLNSAQHDCNDVAAAAAKSQLGEEALYHSWRIYFYAGLLDDAVSACQTLMSRYPQSQYLDDAIFSMGKVSLERGEKTAEEQKAAGDKVAQNADLSRAIGQFGELVRRFPKSAKAPEAMYCTAEAKIIAGQSGLDVLEKLAKQYPDSVYAAKGLIKAADYYVSVGDFRRALEYFSRVITDYPDSPTLGDVQLRRGICQFKLGQNTEALQSFYRVTEEHSGTDLATQAQKFINQINQKRGGKDE